MSKWEMVKLKELATVVSGSTPKTSVSTYWNGEYNWITPAELSEDTSIINETQRKITKLGVDHTGLKSFPKGTVLLSSRAPIGKVAIAGREMFCNQGFKNLICRDELHNKYLFWFLKGKTSFLNSLGRGATFKEISKAIVENIIIPLPPLEVQKKIAQTLGAASELIALRKKQSAELDNLIKSIFYDMFGDPVINEKGWEKKKVKEVCQVKIGPFGSLLHSNDYIQGGIPLINPSHIIKGKLCADNMLTITEEKAQELAQYRMEKDDVVMGRRGEIGRCAVVTDKHDGFLCGTGSLFMKPSQKLNSVYLMQTISSTQMRSVLERAAQGITMKNLNSTIVENIEILLPPLSLQTHFATIVTKIEEQKSLVQKAIDESQSLFDSLMSQYFE
ncbi:restriction endonuclease subunit S [Acetonema longum]|uniref:Restriction modification system DNA specificity domain-containing protein n=1 Tax=Acetonema longum DSM 6540 TaxID=1009370 RepID=F7NKM8_9FIRM|nr:restriction endonuclease subunit S [Acetonema longum]EGO63405.1 restriction modification system DNA specificity domain-containing protein [Acetonema longum DSM 6540]